MGVEFMVFEVLTPDRMGVPAKSTWCGDRELNPGLPACRAGGLTTDLPPQGYAAATVEAVAPVTFGVWFMVFMVVVRATGLEPATVFL